MPATAHSTAISDSVSEFCYFHWFCALSCEEILQLQCRQCLDDARGGIPWQIKTHLQVIVKEFNYVKHNNQCRTFQKPEALKLKSVSTSSALDSQMVETVRLHLWQVFFASPHEWWDNRGRKLYPSSPDFKHKDTGERLWIMPNDPPWVAKQLQLLDSKMTERGQGGLGSARSRLSMWEYEE